MSLPTKSIVIRTGERVLLISPLPDLEKFQEAIEKFGPPTDLIAPNGFHHLGLSKAIKLYPKAKVWGVPILIEKRKDVKWDHILPDDWTLSNELEVIPIYGMPKIQEMVFYHKESKSLIVTDLCFNHIHGSGFGYWLIFKMFGTYKRFAVSKFYEKFIVDRDSFRQSARKIMSLDFDRIIVPHGENLVIQAREKMKNAFIERELL